VGLRRFVTFCKLAPYRNSLTYLWWVLGRYCSAKFGWNRCSSFGSYASREFNRILRSSKCSKSWIRWVLSQTLLRELSLLPQLPTLDFRGHFAAENGQGMRERGKYKELRRTGPLERLVEIDSNSVWLCVGVWHGGGAIQCDVVSSPACREHGRDVLHRQRGTVRHLLPHAEAVNADLRRSQPPRLSHHVRCHHLPTLPRPGRKPLFPHSILAAYPRRWQTLRS